MILKVSGTSVPGKVAGALAARLKEEQTAQIEAVGATAVNQAVKAMAIAGSYVAPAELIATPSFAQGSIEGQERTAIRFTVQMRR